MILEPRLDRGPDRVESRRVLGILALLLLLPLGGCGSSAHRDFDVNDGAVDHVEVDSVEAQRIRELFPLLGDVADSTWGYRIQEGDQLEVAFFSHPEQNRFVTVRPDGQITMPYVGDVPAVRRTPRELASDLQTRYSEVLVSPRVDVIVQEFGARYYVLGEVNDPGEFDFQRPIDLMQALARAGGYADSARLTNIVVMRTDVDGRIFAAVFDFRDFVAEDSRMGMLAVRPADVIWVPRNTLSRWDLAARQLLTGLGLTNRAIIDTWSIVNFSDVYERNFVPNN